MNSVERVHAALKNQIPDRVPVVEFVIDEKIARLAVPGCIDQSDCMDRLDMDAVGCGASFRKISHNPDGSYVDGPGVRVTVHSVSKGAIGLLSTAALDLGVRVRIRLKIGGPREKILHGQTIRCRAYGDGFHEIGVELFPPYPSAGTA